MIKTTSMLKAELSHYAHPAGKIMRMAANGELFPLTRGIYETNNRVPGYCLAPVIYGPSYLSFDFALSQYGLIPEAVYAFTSATFDKKKKKQYNNIFGNYTYRDVPSEAYPLGVRIIEEDGYVYQIATPEKALCDKLYTMSPVRNMHELEILLFENLRIDETEFRKLNRDDLSILCDKYQCKNLKFLKKYSGVEADG